jgi:multicomponent Na+:H+ antiporter subunit E
MQAVDVHRMLPGSAVRVACFLAFWLVIYGFDPLGLLVGIGAALVATAASLRLLPPGGHALRPLALARLVLRFLVGSIRGGIDVAWRALHPQMPLRPGFVAYKPSLAAGPARSAFCTVTGLLPGTLPAGHDENGNILIHCLDMNQPVVEQLAAEEAAFRQALGGGNG